MTTTQEALKMAIEALENVYKTDDQIGFVENAWKNRDARIKALNACKEALEQQAKQLSDDEIKHIGATIFACKLDEVNDADIDFARAIEAKIRAID